MPNRNDYDNKVSESAEELKSTVDHIKNKLSKTAKKEETESLAQILFGGIPKTVLIGFIGVLIFCQLLSFFLSSMPLGHLLSSKEEMIDNENLTRTVVTNRFIEGKIDSKQMIVDTLNEKYGCGGGISNLQVVDDNSSYVYTTDACRITVGYEPNIEEMQTNIYAYVTAVNGALALNDNDEESKAEKTEKPDVQDSLVSFNDENEPELTDEAKRIRDSYDTSNNYKSDTFTRLLQECSDGFFVADDKPTRWEWNNEYTETITYPVKHCYKVSYSGIEQEVACELADDDAYDRVEEEIFTKNIQHADILLTMYYDLAGYRVEDIDQFISDLVATGKYDVFEATEFVYEQINTYYDNYIKQRNATVDENGNEIEGTDNRNKLFEKLLADGTLMYIPISGLTSNYINGEPGYSGSVSGGIDGNSREIWMTINELRRQGILSTNTAMYNCTAFAAYWFYMVHGYDALRGDGKHMATNLVNSYGDKFYIGSSPAPGGIYSIGSSKGANHVGCIDEVGADGTITISEGNYAYTPEVAGTINTGIRIKITMTPEQFYSYVNSTCKYQTKTTYGCTVTFANPYE